MNKSRSIELRKGKVDDRFQFSDAGTTIPSITEKPIESLGKVFESSLRDAASIQATGLELDGWLKAVAQSG